MYKAVGVGGRWVRRGLGGGCSGRAALGELGTRAEVEGGVVDYSLDKGCVVGRAASWVGSGVCRWEVGGVVLVNTIDNVDAVTEPAGFEVSFGAVMGDDLYKFVVL